MSEWIEWRGGCCPVPADTIVEVTFRDGKTDQDRAGDFYWPHEPPSPYTVVRQIIRYRVVYAPPAEAPKDQFLANTPVYDKVLGFLCDLCHPEQFGHAVTKEVRQRARQLAEELEGAAKSCAPM